MRILFKIGIGLVALAALFFLVGLSLPASTQMERSVVIAAPVGEVYPHVADLRRWHDWSAWHKLEPDATWTYSEPASGKGAWGQLRGLAPAHLLGLGFALGAAEHLALRSLPLSDVGAGPLDHLEAIDVALVAGIAPGKQPVAPEHDAADAGILLQRALELEAEVEAGALPGHPAHRVAPDLAGDALGVLRGRAIVEKLAAEGACVVISDVAVDRAEEVAASFKRDASEHAVADVTDKSQVERALERACLAFGGVDIVVNCAGLAISKTLPATEERDWDLLQDVLVKGQFLVSQAGAAIMSKQGTGGDIVNIASKNALVSGPNNVGYGTAKAAQTHMSRLLAAELGPQGVRVNVVNPDAVIGGSKIWEGAWAEGRAKAYGITVEELPAHYAKRTLLNEIIHAEDIADGVFAFVGLLHKSTGNILNVDGGVAAAFTR